MEGTLLGIIVIGCIIAIIWFLNLLRKSGNSSQPKSEQKINRRRLADVKSGDYVQIEWYKIKGGIGYLKCLSNDPETKRIFLEVSWGDREDTHPQKKEKLILDYDSKELENFNLLNKLTDKPKPKDLLSDLNEKLAIAVKEENYKEASVLRDAIQQLGNKAPTTKKK